MIESVTEVNSLEVSGKLDVPRVLRMAVIVGLDDNIPPLRTLEDTAQYLKAIGLTDRVLPTSSISYIEQQAFAKLRRNPKIKEMYGMISGSKPKAAVRPMSRRPPLQVNIDQPSALARKLALEMSDRRRQVKFRKAS